MTLGHTTSDDTENVADASFRLPAVSSNVLPLTLREMVGSEFDEKLLKD